LVGSVMGFSIFQPQNRLVKKQSPTAVSWHLQPP